MRRAERERRRRAYRAWAAGHSRDQAAAVTTTAVILGTMPNPPFAVAVMTRLLQRIAADLAAAVPGTDQTGPPGHNWAMPHITGTGGEVGCPALCPRRLWEQAHA